MFERIIFKTLAVAFTAFLVSLTAYLIVSMWRSL